MVAEGDAKGINILNEQSETKCTQDVGRRVVQVEACGAVAILILAWVKTMGKTRK